MELEVLMKAKSGVPPGNRPERGHPGFAAALLLRGRSGDTQKTSLSPPGKASQIGSPELRSLRPMGYLPGKAGCECNETGHPPRAPRNAERDRARCPCANMPPPTSAMRQQQKPA